MTPTLLFMQPPLLLPCSPSPWLQWCRLPWQPSQLHTPHKGARACALPLTQRGIRMLWRWGVEYSFLRNFWRIRGHGAAVISLSPVWHSRFCSWQMMDGQQLAAPSPPSRFSQSVLFFLFLLYAKNRHVEKQFVTHTAQIYTYEWSASYLLLPDPCMRLLSSLPVCACVCVCWLSSFEAMLPPSVHITNCRIKVLIFSPTSTPEKWIQGWFTHLDWARVTYSKQVLFNGYIYIIL